MTRVISSTELHRRTSELIRHLQDEEEAIIVETWGRPVAVIQTYKAYEEYLAFKRKGVLRSGYPFAPTTLEEVAGCLADGSKAARTVGEMEEGLRNGMHNAQHK